MTGEPVPPLWAAILMSAVFGLIAQFGSAKAFAMDDDSDKLMGFLILSFFFSAFATIFCARIAKIDIYVSIGIGTIVGAVPSLWTLGTGLSFIRKRYDIDIKEMTASNLTPPAKKEEQEETQQL